LIIETVITAITEQNRRKRLFQPGNRIMGAFTSKASGNWTATGQTTWNEVGAPGANDTVSIATGHNITLDQTSPSSVTCTSITIAGTGTLVLPAGAFTINSLIINNGTATTGAIVIGTGQYLLITGPGSGASVTNNGAGYAIAGSSTGTLTITNTNATAVIQNGSTRGISWTGTGAIATTGLVKEAAGSTAIYINGSCTVTFNASGGYAIQESSYGTAITQVTGSVAMTINGDVALTSDSSSGRCMRFSGGTCTLNGLPIWAQTAGLPGSVIDIAGGTVTWVGSRTLAAATSYQLYVNGGTLALANASAALSCANSGNLLIQKSSGTITKTAAGGTAHIINQSSAACAAIIGDGAVSIIDAIPLPTAGNVVVGTGIIGYAGSPITPALASKIVEADGTTHDSGILAGDGYHLNGILIGTGLATDWYADGVLDVAHTEYSATGHYDGSEITAIEDYGLLADYENPGGTWVVVGHDYKYAGSTQTASYPTTADSKGDQLSDDRIAVAAVSAFILDSVENLLGTVDGGFDLTANDISVSLVVLDTVKDTLNANLDEMIVANTTLQAAYGCDAGAAIEGISPGDIDLPETDEVDGDIEYGYPADERKGTGMNATTIRTALGMATANLDTQLAAIGTPATIADAVLDEAKGTHTGFITTLATPAANTFTGAFPSAALVNAPTGATANFSVSTTSTGAAPIVNITQYQYAAFATTSITAAVDQTGDSHAFLVYSPSAPSVVLWSLTTAGGEISVSGSTITLTDTDAHMGTAGVFAYVLRNTTDDTVVCQGSLTIEERPNVPST
jgi:hypothetical protein